MMYAHAISQWYPRTVTRAHISILVNNILEAVPHARMRRPSVRDQTRGVELRARPESSDLTTSEEDVGCVYRRRCSCFGVTKASSTLLYTPSDGGRLICGDTTR